MRVLILGGDGMLGHQLQESWRPRHQVFATLHGPREAYRGRGEGFGEQVLFGVDAREDGPIGRALDLARPDVVVNAVGIVKQLAAAHDPKASIEVNSLLPHRLSGLCALAGVRLVHLSTDCVFSGQKGGYVETDLPDPVDLYGRTKLLGEVVGPGCLTLRTSIIGLELRRRTGLVEWFLSQRGRVKGNARAIYSGLTTEELARALEHLLGQRDPPSGLFHLSSAPIDKHDLLSRLARRLGRTDVTLVPDEAVVCDRSLDSRALSAHTTYRVPSWDAMLDELAERVRRRGELP